MVKQPALGITGTILVIIVSLGFISIFPLISFTTWIAFATTSLIPMLIVISVSWKAKHPQFAARHSQPAKGGLFVLLVLAAGIAVAPAHFFTVGGSISPPTPMLSMCIITTVIIAFWMAIIWGGWPFFTLVKKPVVAGLLMLAASYVLNYLLFRLLFNYEFMRDTPAYVPTLDPHGLFNAWNVVVAYVTTISAMFLMLNFELWPLTKRPSLMRQPLLGLVWTATVLGIGGLALSVGEGLFRLDAPVFMVRVPIPFIFGTIIVMNMLRNTLYARFSQPLKGLVNSATAAIIGVVLARIFGELAPLISGRQVESGHPAYVFEVWLASALLAVTFPFLIIFADLFQFWPLRRASEKSKGPVRAGGETL
jgi:hypothetical protein